MCAEGKAEQFLLLIPLPWLLLPFGQRQNSLAWPPGSACSGPYVSSLVFALPPSTPQLPPPIILSSPLPPLYSASFSHTGFSVPLTTIFSPYPRIFAHAGLLSLEYSRAPTLCVTPQSAMNSCSHAGILRDITPGSTLDMSSNTPLEPEGLLCVLLWAQVEPRTTERNLLGLPTSTRMTHFHVGPMGLAPRLE